MAGFGAPNDTCAEKGDGVVFHELVPGPTTETGRGTGAIAVRDRGKAIDCVIGGKIALRAGKHAGRRGRDPALDRLEDFRNRERRRQSVGDVLEREPMRRSRHDAAHVTCRDLQIRVRVGIAFVKDEVCRGPVHVNIPPEIRRAIELADTSIQTSSPGSAEAVVKNRLLDERQDLYVRATRPVAGGGFDHRPPGRQDLIRIDVRVHAENELLYAV